MLQGILIKKVIDLVMKHLMMNFALDKFSKLVDYVEKPNELDKQVKQLQKNNVKLLKENEEMQKDVALLKKDSHPPQEFICCRKCGCKINKTKSKKQCKKELYGG